MSLSGSVSFLIVTVHPCAYGRSAGCAPSPVPPRGEAPPAQGQGAGRYAPAGPRSPLRPLGASAGALTLRFPPFFGRSAGFFSATALLFASIYLLPG